MLTFKPQNAKGRTIEQAFKDCAEPSIEAKLDGWRLLAVIAEDGPHVFTRGGKEYTQFCPQPILDELTKLPVGTIVDGEIVDLENQDCTAVTNVFGKSKAKPTQEELDKLTYVLFDVPQLAENADIRKRSLKDRRAALAGYVADTDGMGERVIVGANMPVDTAEMANTMYEVLLKNGYEGAMIKDLAKPYAPGKRGHGWFKIKDVTEIDVVITDMQADGKGQHLGKVGRFAVGQYVDGELTHRAWVNPYDDAMRDNMTASLEIAPDDDHIYIGKVCTIKHYGVLKDGLRHPTFVCWREDKPAEECGFDNGV